VRFTTATGLINDFSLKDWELGFSPIDGGIGVSEVIAHDQASASNRGVAVSTAPLSRAHRPTFERFRSLAAASNSSGDFSHQHIVTACTGARGDFRTRSTRTPASDNPLTSSVAGKTTLRRPSQTWGRSCCHAK
jgi:hypothetical protein